ncbi:PstS family phosphate ABC transporter substrate-binding protein [Natrinema thermotolerans]|uniref:PstS family phosphate ABC transporter substrate-binding protein n=1 Tax=Natrinema thermotolerans TaxID=121872 RepID=A0AAF0PAB3_9EURY|nr:PstS family phosphate ABC transporter substrate-binding protein [Natrinema thermotolerans]QCC59847.1 PstS family phosphate ABC transporter substrate-binding protein [Natrinema thermotolerans]WMT06839.1 PstS family phosphate ABC transporter substrate-binding protein [Natrinema thermotolerans]
MADNQFGRDAVSRRKFIAATGAAGTAVIAGCSDTSSGNGDDELSGEVIVKGSSTVFPISDAMAERFMEENPKVNVTVDPTGSGGGFENHFCPGDADINGASRPIKEAEQSHCADNDVTPIEMHIAGDALTVAVSPDNDWVDSMTFDELAQIWGDDSATTWSDINSDWPDEELELYGPDTTSGTYDWFSENVNGGGHRTEYEGTEDDNTIIQGLENSQYAMGYFGYAYYSENKDRVKALSIAESESDEPTAPSLSAAQDGSYPLARPLFIYPAEGALQRDPVYEFVNYYLENSSADWIADDVGYVPSNQDMVDENMSALEDAAGE